MNLKQKIYGHCAALLAGKLTDLQGRLQDLAASAANETKSSAGDKYETSRAMLHMEQDAVRRQIAEVTAQKAVLTAINPDKTALYAGTGSLVITDRVIYFLSVGLGKLLVDGKEVIALSVQSPLGSKLKEAQAGDSIMLNGQELPVKEIW